MAIAAYSQPHCNGGDPCKGRPTASERFFVFSPNLAIAEKLLSSIDSKASGDRNFFVATKSVLKYSLFEEDWYDALLGECGCGKAFSSRKTVHMSCLTYGSFWHDVLGRTFVEKECSHQYYTMFLQLYSLAIVKKSR